MRPLHALTLVAVVFLLYANILPNPFVWDDNIFILQNQFIRDWKSLPSLFKSEFFSKSQAESSFKEGGYYRPLVMVLYTIEYQVWGEHPSGYHLTSILLHLLNVFLVYFLIQKLFQHQTISFIGSLLFASHPLHTEAVSYLPSRGDLLATLFCLASFLSYRSTKQFLKRFSPFLFAMGLLSKESVAVFPLLLSVFDACFPAQKDQKRWASLSLHWLVLVFYLMLRFLLFPFRLTSWMTHSPGLVFRILSMGKLLISYLALLLFPYPLHLERSVPFQSTFWDMGTVLFLSGGFGAFLLCKFLWEENRQLFFGIVWFLITLLPVSNIIPIHPSMAEHYLYFPSIGLFAVLSFSVNKLFLKTQKEIFKKTLFVFGFLIFACYATLLTHRNKDYSDDMRLFSQTLQYSPKNPLIHNNLGSVYFSRGFIEEAKREFEISLSLNPHQPMVWTNLGTLYRESKHYEKAIHLLRRALGQTGDNAVIWNKLGVAYAESGEEEAVSAFRKAIALDPTYADAYFNLGSYYWKKGELTKTASLWEEGLRRNPNHPGLKKWLPRLKGKMSQER